MQGGVPIKPSATFVTNTSFTLLYDKCKRISDTTIADVLIPLLDTIQQLNNALSAQKNTQVLMEKWLCHTLQFQSEKDITDFANDFNISRAMEQQMIIKHKTSQWDVFKKRDGFSNKGGRQTSYDKYNQSKYLPKESYFNKVEKGDKSTKDHYNKRSSIDKDTEREQGTSDIHSVHYTTPTLQSVEQEKPNTPLKLNTNAKFVPKKKKESAAGVPLKLNAKFVPKKPSSDKPDTQLYKFTASKFTPTRHSLTKSLSTTSEVESMDNFYEDHPLSSNSVDLALSTQKIPDEKEKNVVQQDDVIVASMEFCDDFEEPKPFTVTSPLQQNKIKHHIQSSVLANYVPKKQPQITPSTPSKPSQPKQKILLATPQIEQKIPTRQTVAQDDFVQEFMNNHKQELIDLTKTKDIELVFNSTQMNGLESVLQYPGIIVVLFSGDYIFGFQVTSSNNLIGFTIKNPFDIIPITFSLKNKADFTVDINTKHRILEVWHFIRLTGDEGFISDDFTDYYDDSTEVGPDLFIGEHQPELFSLDRFLAFRPY